MPDTEHRPTERVLDILELLASNLDGMTLTEISHELAAPKSSVMPLVHTMAARKFIVMDKSSSRYYIGIAAYSVGSAYISNRNALQFIRSEMRYIVEKGGETCQLGVRDHGMLLYIAKEDSPEPIRLVSYVGKRLPLYCAAMGKAILMQCGREELRQMYPDGLKPLTSHTIVDFDRLHSDLEMSRELGYTMEYEEATDHVCCIAVPLRSESEIVAGLSVSIPSFRMTEEKSGHIIELLQEAQMKIEAYFRENRIDSASLTMIHST